MAITQADLDNLNAAIAAGELEVQHSDGTRVRYRSIAEMREAYAHLQGIISGSSGAGGGGTFYFNPVTQRD